VLHTYVIYPWWVVNTGPTQAKGKLEARAQVPKTDKEQGDPPWPSVAVLMAAHNEETVLEQKLQSLFAQDYPGELNIFIGSDCSTDATNQILTDWSERDPRFHPTFYTVRQGKPGIINQLAERTIHDSGLKNNEAPPLPTTVLPTTNDQRPTIFIITDASVILRPNTITELVRPMQKDPSIGVVDATMIQTGGTAEGIGQAEESYIHREVEIKRAESRRWGAMIGPFGGCWAIRAKAFTPVPDNFLVDDFFLCMAAYEQGYLGISSPDAVVEEAVGQSLHDEFRRKVRISSGNWQNLVRFRKLWWPFWKSSLAFAFFSHKVLRWWTPFLLLIGLAAWILLLLILGPEINYWPGMALLVLTGLILLLVVLDRVLSPLNVHFRPGRYLSYFIAMNAALLVGCWRYLTGIKSNVWQPSQRL
jgi:cellulose synthase/poly-beta-1,6-N-acetylglucosamine synthase-like glycosyltransferase